MEEKDPRSIKIRKGYKPLREYLEILRNLETYYPIGKLEKLDDIFLSFLDEEDYETCFEALKLLFTKIEFYGLELANCKIAFNIGKLLDCFLTKFKDELTEVDINSLHEIIPKIKSGSLELHNLKDTEYIIAMIFLKHYDPDAYQKEENNIFSRLEKNDGVDDCITKLQKIYGYRDERLNNLIYFQLRSFVLIRNTMIITEDFINESISLLINNDYPDDWITIFANKMLSHVIVPLISQRQQKKKSCKIQIEDKTLLKWLLIFSEKSWGRKVREDKWESINDEDFDWTWDFVKEHASLTEIEIFYKYLKRNRFEFFIADPFSDYKRKI